MKQHIEGALWVVSFGSLLAAAYSSSRTPVFVLAILWLGSTAIVIPMHFYRAWKNLAGVPNKRLYSLWVGLETVATIALVAIGIYSATQK